jgi:DNA repair protein SbcD/Mre11
MKVIILGDPHLGKGASLGKTGLGSILNSRITDQINLLDWTLDQAIEHGADSIIITGDVFDDTKPHPSLIALLVSWLKKCQAHYVSVKIIMGNHCMLRSGSIFTSSLDIISEMDLEGIEVHKNINTIFIGTSAFTLIPFRDRKSFGVSHYQEALKIIQDSLIYELASIPTSYQKIVVGHLAIEGSIPVGDEIDDITNELFCPLDMFQGYDYVWMGHVHKPQVMQKNDPYIAHVGSMDISNFSETDQKKHIVIVDCQAHTYSIQYLPTRSLKKVVVVVPKEIEDTTDYVLKELDKAHSDYSQAIVRVEISLATPEQKSVNKSQVEDFLLKQGVFNITGISESKKIVLIRKNAGSTGSIDSKMDVPMAIKTYADRQLEASIRADYIEMSMEIFNLCKAESKE